MKDFPKKEKKVLWRNIQITEHQFLFTFLSVHIVGRNILYQVYPIFF